MIYLNIHKVRQYGITKTGEQPMQITKYLRLTKDWSTNNYDTLIFDNGYAHFQCSSFNFKDKNTVLTFIEACQDLESLYIQDYGYNDELISYTEANVVIYDLMTEYQQIAINNPYFFVHLYESYFVTIEQKEDIEAGDSKYLTDEYIHLESIEDTTLNIFKIGFNKDVDEQIELLNR